MRHCVFCGYDGKLHAEHAWPAWIRDVLPDGAVKGYSQQHRVAVGTGEVTEITPLMRHKAADRKVKVVCQDCNGGWMSDLEVAAKPVLVPMIRGEQTEPVDQTLLSFWAAKTAMMLQFMHPEELRGIPVAHYQHVYEQHEAPQDMRVWLTAATERFYRTAHYMRAYRLPGAAPPWTLVPGVQRPPDAYTSVMVIGRLVISLVGWMIPGWEFTTAPDDPWRTARRCIWPPQSDGWTWPPEAALTSLVEVEQFAAAATT